ncbi:MAG: bifunctional 2-polyprenyl-6-hydroxyphenol methylase/3-demethylubiquinol 3-O-methyltransferase UbiG [Candidatus Undinarchaeales archaeon]
MQFKKFIVQEKPFYKKDLCPEKFIEKYLEKYESLYYSRKVQEIKRLLPETIENKKVLDIGCCGGYLSIMLAKMGAKVTGIDSSKPAITAAKYYAKNEKVKSKCQFIHSDINKIEIKKKFDLILAKDVIEHIEKDIEFLKKAYKLLKREGNIIITTQNSHSFNYLFEGLIRKLFGQKKWVGWDPTHLRWYNAPALKRKLKKAGFKPVKFSGSYYKPYEMINKIFNKNLKSTAVVLIDDCLGHVRPFNRWGWSISVKGKKIKREKNA